MNEDIITIICAFTNLSVVLGLAYINIMQRRTILNLSKDNQALWEVNDAMLPVAITYCLKQALKAEDYETAKRCTDILTKLKKKAK